CTAPQNVYVPRDGITTAEGRMSFDEVAQALAQAVERTMSDPAKAVELTGAIQNEATVERIEAARALGMPVLCDSRALEHPQFAQARVRTPLMLKADASDTRILQEWFGPIVFIVEIGRASCRESVQIAVEADAL